MEKIFFFIILALDTIESTPLIFIQLSASNRVDDLYISKRCCKISLESGKGSCFKVERYIDFSTDNYVKLYLKPEHPIFSIDVLSSISHTIDDSLMWTIESMKEIPDYKEKFILSEDYNIAVQPHNNYLISHVDINYFTVFLKVVKVVLDLF